MAQRELSPEEIVDLVEEYLTIEATPMTPAEPVDDEAADAFRPADDGEMDFED